MAADREELLLLRVQDPDLAERLHAVLSERPDAPKDPLVELRFDGASSVICCITEITCSPTGPELVLSSIDDILTSEYAWVAEDGEGRKGIFTFDDIVLPASLKDLPTIVESYKTYDDINLVKTGDIGQVIISLAHSSAVGLSSCRNAVLSSCEANAAEQKGPQGVLH